MRGNTIATAKTTLEQVATAADLHMRARTYAHTRIRTHILMMLFVVAVDIIDVATVVAADVFAIVASVVAADVFC